MVVFFQRRFFYALKQCRSTNVEDLDRIIGVYGIIVCTVMGAAVTVASHTAGSMSSCILLRVSLDQGLWSFPLVAWKPLVAF